MKKVIKPLHKLPILSCFLFSFQVKEAGIALGLIEDENAARNVDGRVEIIDGDSDSDSESGSGEVQYGKPSMASAGVVIATDTGLDHRAEELDQKLEGEINDNDAEPDLNETFELDEDQEQKVPADETQKQNGGQNAAKDQTVNHEQDSKAEVSPEANKVEQDAEISSTGEDSSQSKPEDLNLQIVEPIVDLSQEQQVDCKGEQSAEKQLSVDSETDSDSKKDRNELVIQEPELNQSIAPEIDESMPESTANIEQQSQANHQTPSQIS